jgi:hypothetical protein
MKPLGNSKTWSKHKQQLVGVDFLKDGWYHSGRHNSKDITRLSGPIKRAVIGQLLSYRNYGTLLGICGNTVTASYTRRRI